MTAPTDPMPEESNDPAAAPPPEASAPTPRRLTRSREDRMLAGVAGGIAEYFDLDASIIRIAMVVLAFVTGGTAVLLYGGAWLVLPAGPPSTSTVAAEAASVSGEQPKRRRRRSAAPGLVWGLLLIVAGALLLARQADVSLPPVEGVLAAGLIVIGLLLLFEARRGLNSGLIVLAVMIAAGLAFTSHGDVQYDGAFSERAVAIERVEDLEDSYGHAFGQLQLDLRGMTFPEGTTEITVSVAFGSAEVLVPRDIPVRVEGTTLFGSTELRGPEIGGFGVDTARSESGYSSASKRLLIHVTTLFGSTEVR